MSILIRNAIVITMDHQRRVLTPGSVLINGGRIQQVSDSNVGSRSEIVIEGKGKIVLPGLINTHAHVYQTLFRGMGDGLALLDWLRKLILPSYPLLKERDWYYSTAAGCLELIRSGCTLCVDLNILMKDKARTGSYMRAYSESGLRVVAVGMGLDVDDFHIVPEEILQDTETSMKSFEDLFESWHQKENGRISVWPGAGTVFTTSKDFLLEAKSFAETHTLGITMHVQETKEETEKWKKTHGMSPIGYLHKKIGLHGRRMVAAHCVWVDDEDIETLSSTNTNVAHNPISNMRLGSGIAPITEMRKRGINVSLGTDGAACNDNLDMIEVLKATALLQRARQLNPAALSAQDVLEMATIDGARALGMEDEVGSIETGKRADIIIVDLNKLNSSPVNHTVTQLVLSGRASNVETVIIDGKIVMRDGAIQSLDEHAVIGVAQESAARIMEQDGMVRT